MILNMKIEISEEDFKRALCVAWESRYGDPLNPLDISDLKIGGCVLQNDVENLMLGSCMTELIDIDSITMERIE